MEFDRVVLKQRARRDMQKKRPSVLLVSLVYLLLTTGISTAVGQLAFGPLSRVLAVAEGQGLNGAELIELIREQGVDLTATLVVGGVLTVVVSLFASVLELGYTGYTLKLAKKEQAGFGSLLSGFGMLGRALGVQIMLSVYSILWGLAFIAPAITLGALAYWLLADFGELATLLLVTLLLAAYVLTYAQLLRYSLALHALADDPELGVFGAIRRSKELMKGRRWELVKLFLSFLGWYLLAYFVIMTAAYVGVVIVMIVMEAAYLSGAAGDLDAMVGTMMNNTWVVTLVMEAGSILFMMWLTPYMSLTVSHFYLSAVAAETAREAPAPVAAGPAGWGEAPTPPRPVPPPAPPVEPPAPFTLPTPEEPSAPAEEGETPPPPAGEEPPAPAEKPQDPPKDPWDYKPTDSRRNPDDPF